MGLVRELPVGRHLAVDDRGVGLRATWRLHHGFINLSLWRGDICVETFHLTPADAADLIAFLSKGLADATSVATAAHLTAIDGGRADRPVAPPSLADRVVAWGRRTLSRPAGARWRPGGGAARPPRRRP